jgi:hypothetical protein
VGKRNGEMRKWSWMKTSDSNGKREREGARMMHRGLERLEGLSLHLVSVERVSVDV